MDLVLREGTKMFKKILSKDRKTIVTFLLLFLFGLMLLLQKDGNKYIGLALTGLSFYYLMTETVEGPISFVFSILSLTLFNSQALTISQIANIETVISMSFALYFAILSSSYFIKNSKGDFILSLIGSALFTGIIILTRNLAINQLIIRIIVFVIILLIFTLFFKRQNTRRS